MNCKCGFSTIQKLSRSDNNVARPYFGCSLRNFGGKEGCDFFEWVGADIPRALNSVSSPTAIPQSRGYQLNAKSFSIYPNDAKNQASSGLSHQTMKNDEIGSSSNGGENKSVMHLPALSSKQMNLDVHFHVHCFKENPYSIELSISFLRNVDIENLLRNSFPSEKCRYDSSLKLWIIDFSIYEKLMSYLQSSEYSKFVTISTEIPQFLSRGFDSYLNNLKTIRDANKKDSEIELDIPKSLKDTLLDFQISGIKFIIRRGGKGMIADDMGCGKTIQAISLLFHYRQHWPALLIVPATLVSTWVGQLKQFAPPELLKDEEVVVIKKGSDLIGGKVCIIPYSLMHILVEKRKINTKSYDIIIADETHAIKSKDAKVTAAVMPLLKKSKVTVCLTGTPAINRPVELFTQISSILPNVFRSYDHFTQRYCDPKQKFMQGKNITDVKGSSNASELKKILEGMVMIRRLKQDVLTLPPKIRDVRYCNVDDANILREMSDIKAKLSSITQQMNASSVPDQKRSELQIQRQVIQTQYYCLTGRAKIPSVLLELQKIIQEVTIQREEACAKKDIEDNVKNSTETLGNDSTYIYHDNDNSPSKNDTSNEPMCTSIDKKESCNTILSKLEDDECVFFGSSSEKNQLDLTSNTYHENEVKKSTSTNNASDNICDSSSSASSDSDDPFAVDNQKKRKSVGKKVSRERLSSKKLKASNKSIKSELIGYSIFDDNDNKNDAWNSLLGENALMSEKNTGKKKLKKTKISEKNNDTTSSTSSKKKKTIPDKLEANKKHRLLGEKIIVFAYHRDVMDSIETWLRDEEIRYIRIDGDVSKSARANAINTFQEDDVTNVALLSIGCCSTGITLTRASVTLFAELAWSAGDVMQAEDRTHRIGQQAKFVRLRYLLLRGSFDDAMWDDLQKKIAVLGATVGIATNQKLVGGLTSSDLKRTKSSRSDDLKVSSSQLSQGKLDSFLTTKHAGSELIDQDSEISTPFIYDLNQQKNQIGNICGPIYISQHQHQEPKQSREIEQNKNDTYISTNQLQIGNLIEGATSDVLLNNKFHEKKPLSPNTKARIEENKRKAQERRNAINQKQNSNNITMPLTNKVGHLVDNNHVFNTGSGSTIQVSSESVKRAVVRLSVTNNTTQSNIGPAPSLAAKNLHKPAQLQPPQALLNFELPTKSVSLDQRSTNTICIAKTKKFVD